MKKIFVTGGTGLVGSFFVENYSGKYKIIAPDYPKIDLTKKETFENIIREEKPDAVLHFAAYTDVTQAENQRDDRSGSCWQINVEGTKNLASLAKEINAHFIHISTDYCFSGSSDDPGPYDEDHPIEKDEKKLTWYGFTKAEAEREVTKILGNSFSIVRLIYPVRGKFDAKLDYIRKPLSLFDQGKLYPLFTDQQVSVTYIDEACQAINKVIEDNKDGVFHASTTDTTTPYELVSYVIEKTRGVKNAVKKSSLADFLKTVDNPTRYPKYGGLKVEETQKTLGMKFSSWKEMVDALTPYLSIS